MEKLYADSDVHFLIVWERTDSYAVYMPIADDAGPPVKVASGTLEYCCDYIKVIDNVGV